MGKTLESAFTQSYRAFAFGMAASCKSNDAETLIVAFLDKRITSVQCR